MTWLFFAILSYFTLAVVSVFDKFILSKNVIPRPAVFAIYTGLTSVWGLFLIPFGFSLSAALANPFMMMLAISAGIAFVIALVPYYTAAKEDEISRVAPVSGIITVLFTFLLALLFLEERLNGIQLMSFALLVAGGFLISFKKFKKDSLVRKFGLISVAGFLFALSFVLAKGAYEETTFLNAFILYEIGFVAAGILLLMIPKNRRAFAEHAKGINVKIVGVFGINKVFAGLYFILLNYAMFLGSVSLVQALQGLQYVFLLIFTGLLSWKLPYLLEEELSGKIIAKKTVAIAFIAFGLLILTLSQRPQELAPGATVWGVTFSKPFAEQMGLNWQETYRAILDDLNARHLRLIAYWPEIEKNEGLFSFEDLDWQVREAEKRGAKVILAVGQKLPRWPECHEPKWVQNQKSNIKNQNLLKYIEATINHYKDNPAIRAWQVENEPFLAFGECPALDVELLDKEIALVRSLDNRPVIVSDSGELSAWVRAAKRADIFGTTMYRIIWNKSIPFGGYLTYPLPPEFFHLKTNFASYFTDIKRVIVVELQAEPWGPKLLYESPFEEQQKSMNFEQFKKNIEYAKAVGFSENYLWGVEWWERMKQDGHPEYWEEIKRLIRQSELQ